MREAVIVDAVRTPIGKREGSLKGWHPVDLLAHTLNALIERNPFDPALVDDVIGGCVMQVGEQAVNVTRNAVLAAGWPESVPATSVDRQCGSSQQALHFAAQGILAGSYDIAIACGVECMTRVPLGSSAVGPGKPFGPRMDARYGGVAFNQGISAEMLAERWNLTRGELDAYSLESHRRADRASSEGWFAGQMVPVPLDDGSLFTRDEGIRPGTPPEKMASLKTVFKAGGVVTAGNSSQISDGAAAVLVMERGRALELGLRPRARLVEFALAAEDPVIMLTGPIPATRKLLARAGLSLAQVDLVEINEAFASVVLAWRKELDADLDRCERQRRRGGARTSIGRQRRPPHDHSGARARASWRPLRPANDVRGWRHGQRHPHRRPRLTPGLEPCATASGSGAASCRQLRTPSPHIGSPRRSGFQCGSYPAAGASSCCRGLTRPALR